jgi:4-deoxy-L-threo-5-hexosulose-uronate ketol-isomerase
VEIRHPTHPDGAGRLSTAELRAQYLVEGLFSADAPGGVRAVYTHHDRVVVAGVAPAAGASVPLPTFDPLRSAYFLQRREIGVVNVGGAGTVTVDGEPYPLAHGDCLYVGRGAVHVTFASDGTSDGTADGGAARFYLVSTPAHATHPTRLARVAETEGLRLGDPAGSNDRTIYKYVHADGIRSCQLVLGVTVLEPGSMWNTMPCHTHDRRTETYLYYDLPAEHRVVHLMGRPDETRNLVVANEQAVISPSWSVHFGFGTASYAFVWAMAGENQAFDDLDPVAIAELR